MYMLAALQKSYGDDGADKGNDVFGESWWRIFSKYNWEVLRLYTVYCLWFSYCI